MNQKFVDIASSSNITYSDFGNKAANLSALARAMPEVPSGFCISIDAVRSIAEGKLSTVEHNKLKRKFDSLIRSSRTHKVILRSSSLYEDDVDSQFAGLLNSELGIQSYESLIENIKKACASSKRREIDPYYSSKGIDKTKSHLGLIVQEEFKCELSGFAYVSESSVIIEFNKGNLNRLANGTTKPSLVIFVYDSSECNWKIQFNPNALVSTNILQNIRDHIPLFVKASSLLSYEQAIIEFGSSNSRLKIFQIRPSSQKIERELGFDSGFKAESTKYFQSEMLFNKNVVFINPDTTDSEVIEIVARSAIDDSKGVTVRFSYKDTLSLPRSFVNTKEEAIKLILKTRKPGWTAIIHEYLDVESSFELLVDKSSAVLEHVPGIWESDSILQPDAIHFYNGLLKVWRYKNKRQAKFIAPTDSQIRDEPAVDRETLFNWSCKIKPIIEKLQRDFESSLPLNFHFVGDSSGEWSFLNLRKGFLFDESRLISSGFHIVTNKQDIDNWDRVSPIILRLSTARGKEADLLDVAKHLPLNFRSIFIDFGILSHPAMVLREYGHKLKPSYLLNNYAQPEYDNYELNIDISYDPHNRIMGEKAVIEDDFFKIVFDREPISTHHLLVVSKEKVESIADNVNYSSLISKLEGGEFEAYLGKDWVYLERGRAAFCTSGFTSKQAHCHLLSAADFKIDCLDKLAKEVSAESVGDMRTAFQRAANSGSEFLLFGSERTDFFLKETPQLSKAQKRFLRAFMTDNLKHGNPK